MSNAANDVRDPVERLLVTPHSAWPLAIARIIYGLVLMAWTATLAVDADTFLGADGLVPPEFADRSGWNLLNLSSGTEASIALIALFIAGAMITIGWHPTWWLVASFFVIVALQRRDLMILNSGDLLLRDFALLFALCPTSAALSVDRWRAYGRGSLSSAPNIAPWGLRLIQLQMMVIYFFAFWSKSGELWINGTAVSTALRLDDLQRFGAPGWLVGNVVVIAILTWGTLAVELALALLLWYKPLRPVLLALAFALHFFIDIMMMVGFFGLLMFAGLTTFFDPRWIERIAARRGGTVKATQQTTPSAGVLPPPTAGSASSAGPGSAPVQ